MGVPKFFRYMSERYPCLSEFIKEYQIPIFDNLYLDMNGIIHMCSHPDDNNPHFRITEEKLFSDIFHYIEFLFRMIKPQKVFFMAIDGVAPRAKMNQQRGRRFRSAKDAEKSEAEAKKKGEKLPDVARFDSNCITPGTEFMAKLQEQLKYFVVNKVSTDKLWKKCKVILSGHETPGEGEHKIMDYIRYSRSRPGYDPNTRHCLYGLDADLIMLGLCTHDPHFSLLREEVKFGKKSTKRNNVPEEIRFYLLHLSLMREYLELEFKPLQGKLEGFEYDLEKIIDDWVLMGFLVGNDFIPNLPNLHITNGALPVLYKAYMEILPTLDGYINEGGTLNLKRFEKFMAKLGDIDLENFAEIKEDLLYMEAKTGRKAVAHVAVSTKYDGKEGEADQHKPIDPALAALIQDAEDLAMESDSDEESGDSDDQDSAFKSYKDEYYRNKMEFSKVTKGVMKDQAEGYVRAIQWNLNYYYNGVASWSWYYPHHYSPYISDIKGFSDLKIDFDLGTPFKPYEQLLAVLPAASKDLLPKAYHHLMTEDDSLIKDYYPENFQTDLNGKRQEWEAVVLVPFIDENILLEAMKPCNEVLSPDEVKRNTHGPMLVYHYTDDDLGAYEAPEYFPTIAQNHAFCTPFSIEDLRVPKDKLIKGAYPGVRFDVFYPGFPTMKHLKYKGEFRKAKVKIFEHPSRGDNMILTVIPNELYFEDTLPQELLDKAVFVGWPHLVEAKIEALSNTSTKITVPASKSDKPKVTQNSEATFKQEMEGITSLSHSTMGIDFGQTKVLVHVKKLIGRRYIFSANGRMNLQKQYDSIVSSYPLQAVVMDINVHDEAHATYRDVNEVFSEGSQCYILSNPHYGCLGTILDSQACLKNDQLKVQLSVVDEPDLTKVKEINDKSAMKYMSLQDCCTQIAISKCAFSRITGSIFIQTINSEHCPKSVNIGLDLKFNKKNQETPGYTKRMTTVWYYTAKTVELVREYSIKFPEVFRCIMNYYDKNDDLDANQVFGEDCHEKVKTLQTWLKNLPTHNVERRVCYGSVIEPDAVAELEKIVDEYKPVEKNIVLQLKPHFLYKPEMEIGNVQPDRSTKTHVLDRIVNVKEGITVPVGLKGTVIAVLKSTDLLSSGRNGIMYDVVFDSVFAGGVPLNCSDQRGYRLPNTCFINISHGKRLMEEKTGKPGELLAMARNQQNSFRPSHSYNFNNARPQNSAFASFTTNNGRQPNVQSQQQQYNRNNQQQQYGQQQQYTQQQQQQSYHHQQGGSYNFNQDTSAAYPNQKYRSGGGGGGGHPPAVTPGRLPEKPAKMEQQLVKLMTKPPRVENPEEANTDFLKKVLKIQSNPANDRTNKQNAVDVSVIPFNKPQEKKRASPPGQSIDLAKMFSQDSTSRATAKLLTYYQANSLGCPRYLYLEMKPGFYAAQLTLPTNKKVTGKEAKTKEEASELVAAEALNYLKGVPNVSKDVPPAAAFPEPPKNWVQHSSNNNKGSTQVFTNRNFQQQQQQQNFQHPLQQHYNQRYPSHQGHQSSQQQPQQQQQQQQQQPPKRPSANSANNVKSSPSASSFVPLQAIMKRQTGRNSHGSAGNRGGNTVQSKSEKNNESKVIPTQVFAKEQHSPGTRQTERNNPARKRKTRIAANFVAKTN